MLWMNITKCLHIFILLALKGETIFRIFDVLIWIHKSAMSPISTWAVSSLCHACRTNCLELFPAWMLLCGTCYWTCTASCPGRIMYAYVWLLGPGRISLICTEHKHVLQGLYVFFCEFSMYFYLFFFPCAICSRTTSVRNPSSTRVCMPPSSSSSSL